MEAGAMRVRVKEVGGGQHPSELIVQVDTKEGTAKLVVDKRSIKNNTIEIGYPVASEDGYVLVELPSETMAGEWRVWVSEAILQDAVFAA
jgi:hypothetical protein